MGETKLQLQARHASVETQRAIGRSLRDLRTDAGLSIAAVAREAGIDRSFLSRIERGDRAAGVAVLTAIATFSARICPSRHSRTPAPGSATASRLPWRRR